MANPVNFYIVSAAAMPEILLRVLQAKQLLEQGQASTVAEASASVGISRSAFYKYRDAVFPFQSLMAGRIITFQLTLADQQGVLSSVLSNFAQSGANILTINQSIPYNGCAPVTITAQTTSMHLSVEELLSQLGTLHGVVKAEILAG